MEWYSGDFVLTTKTQLFKPGDKVLVKRKTLGTILNGEILEITGIDYFKAILIGFSSTIPDDTQTEYPPFVPWAVIDLAIRNRFESLISGRLKYCWWLTEREMIALDHEFNGKCYCGSNAYIEMYNVKCTNNKCEFFK